jgi:hypothetical protein
MATWNSGVCPPRTNIVRLDQRDPLDHYREAVERLLGEYVESLREEDFERFLFQVITSFELGVAAQACAVTWLVRNGLPSGNPDSGEH